MPATRPAALPLALMILGLALSPARAEDGKLPNDPDAPLPVRVNQAIDAGVKWLTDRDGKPSALKNVFTAGNWSDTVVGNRLYDPEAKGDLFVHPTGCTSLALYALLKSGVEPGDPIIKKGFDWLRGGSSSITSGKGKEKKFVHRIPNGTYELAVLILALEARYNPHKREKERERDLRFRLKKGEKLKLVVKLDASDESWMKELVEALKKRVVGTTSGGRAWRYGHWSGKDWNNGVRGDKDLSATNLAMLALSAAERCGLPQEERLYADVLRWTLSLQEKEGPEVPRWDPSLKEDDRAYGVGKDQARGFGYMGTDGSDEEHVPTGSMTACGLANIVLCRTFLESRESPLLTGELTQAAEKGWWDGIAWLDQHWTVDYNVNRSNYHYYYLYCLERACDLKGINLVAGRPWYNLGAEVLVDDQNKEFPLKDGAMQAPDGGWHKKDTHEPSEILNTCFALLFLNRATPAITGD